MTDKKILIAYYSFGGNTKRIAKMIQKEIGGDLYPIQTVEAYKGSYNDIVEQGQKEVNSKFKPVIKQVDLNVSDYDTIVLGSPVWWYTFAPAMLTFLSQNNFADKKIYPFATNAGWIGRTMKDYEKACMGADVKKGLNVVFDEKNFKTSESEILNWVHSIY